MSSAIPHSELVCNADGSVYHLGLHPDQMAETIILVGDPDRVGKVSQYFDQIEHKIQKREFVTHTGTLGNKRLSVVSTGISTDNIDIALNELDILANIDLDIRTPKHQLTQLNIIRIGTTGGLRESVPVDSFVASHSGIGMDGLLHFYKRPLSNHEASLNDAFSQLIQIEGTLPPPYSAEGNQALINLFESGCIIGHTLTCPGFYGPQGRKIRSSLTLPDILDRCAQFEHNGVALTNFEMETAGIYGMGRVLGHKCCSLSVVLANRTLKEFTQDGDAAVEKLITFTLSKISASDLI